MHKYIMAEVLHNRGNLVFNESIQECEVHQHEPQLRAHWVSSRPETLIDIEMQVLLLHPTELGGRKTSK